MTNGIFHQQTASFILWFSQLPGSHLSQKISLADLRSKGAGRGLVAVQDIDKGEALFVVPRDSILSVQNSELSQRIPGIATELGSWLSLIVVLVCEYIKGHNSIWAPYLEILPRSFNTLMYWSQQEIDHLQASAIVTKIGREEATRVFADKLVPFVRKYQDLIHPEGMKQLPDNELVSLAHRMGSTVMAYGFDLETEKDELGVDEDGFFLNEEADMPKGMIPMADMLNANGSFNARLYQETKTFIMKACRHISVGEEIYNDYGPLPRADLLRRYGYISDHYSRYDVAELPRDVIIEALKDHLSSTISEVCLKLDFLRKCELLDDGFTLTRHKNDAPVPRELQRFVEILVSDSTEFDRIHELSPKRKSEIADKAAKVIRQALTYRLLQYQTTLDDDLNLIKDLSTTGRERIAIKIRIAEKQILTHGFKHLDHSSGE